MWKNDALCVREFTIAVIEKRYFTHLGSNLRPQLIGQAFHQFRIRSKRLKINITCIRPTHIREIYAVNQEGITKKRSPVAGSWHACSQLGTSSALSLLMHSGCPPKSGCRLWCDFAPRGRASPRPTRSDNNESEAAKCAKIRL